MLDSFRYPAQSFNALMAGLRGVSWLSALFFLFLFGFEPAACSGQQPPLRIFIFAGQSNMVGSDSKVQDIQRFPPFHGLENAQPSVKFSFCLGRENKMRSNGWVNLQPVDNVVGPELSFARKVLRHTKEPIAIIKCAA